MALDYAGYYRTRSAIEGLLPHTSDIKNELVPELIRLKAKEFRLIILGALAEIAEEGWEDEE